MYKIQRNYKKNKKGIHFISVQKVVNWSESNSDVTPSLLKYIL